MCIHGESTNRRYNEKMEKERQTYRTVSLRTKEGRLVAGWPAPYVNSQSIANTIRDLKEWHSAIPDIWVDMSDINKARIADGLEALDNAGLPFAIGEPLPQEMDVDVVVARDPDFVEFEKGLKKYSEAQRKQLERVPVMVGA